MTDLQPDRITRPLDYWVIRFCRDASVIIVFLVALIVQVGISRVLVLTLVSGLMIILVGHMLTKGRYYPSKKLKFAFQPSNWSPNVKWLVVSYFAFVAWMIVTMFWSPVPQKGLKNIFVIMPLLPLVYFMALEHSKFIIAPFLLILRIGLFAAIILLILEMEKVTAFHKLDGSDARLYDLNRNAAYIAMMCWVPVLFIGKHKAERLIYFLGVFATGIAVLQSESEAVKVSYVIAAITGVLVYLRPYLGRVLVFALILVTISFPFILPSLDRFSGIEKGGIFKNGHADHRMSLWLGYQELIVQKPIFGWGIKANRYLGENGQAAKVAKERGFPSATTNPHNFILELWIDFGLIGILLLSACLLFLERIIRGLKRMQYVVACQLIAAGYTFSATASSFFQGWWLSILIMVSIAFIVAYRQSNVEPISST